VVFLGKRVNTVDEDKSEQSEKNHGFTTPETLDHARKHPDPILIWAAAGKLNAVLEEIVIKIRVGKKVTSGNLDAKVKDYDAIHSTASNDPEAKEGRLYREWSVKVIKRFGYKEFCSIMRCILEGKKCDFEMFKKSLQLY
jgi:hypothetical protein